ncbi:hypothetical protein DQ384_38390 [Sphaerisporangium album]|uniref:Uncharacterized protein n=1 Tax=Sphaerisporangium album TaxID=509200 RepID=A0A367EN10_9ACTN|nr:hypothetical protein [Sphaerisporangium album]RCG19149.1 hypothetical protein DQ384_38390 [Sphaerisporangium album]
MSYQPVLSERALAQMGGFPSDALSALGETMALVCRDPYDPLVTMPTAEHAQLRRADFGDGRGFVTFLILDAVNVVRVIDITWVG